MPVESFTYITSLNQNWPVGTDLLSQQDDHSRGIKKTVQDSFPNIDGPVTCAPADLNQFTGSAAGGSGLAVTGMISAYAGAIAPNAWLLCDGAAIDGAHTALIALVGANTPNLQGQFLRGWSPDAAVDPDGPRAPLLAQAAAFESHTHSVDIDSSQQGGGASNDALFPDGTAGPISITSAAAGGAETRPVNVTVSYIIKI
jgi:microcystin-dependent protein